MPFTTAHTALALPLKKLWPSHFLLTGLMAGSMAPDLIYFLQMTTTSRGLGHSWPGLFYFCLPAGLAFSFAFHWLFKRNFIYNLPSPFDRALSGLAESTFVVRGVKSWSTLILSVLIGTLSHFFWDSFTHRDGELAQVIPFLTDYTTVLGLKVLNARIAQHVSTVAGTVALVVGLWKWHLLPVRRPGFEPLRAGEKFRFWLLHGTIAGVFAAGAVVIYNRYFPDYLVSNATTFGLASWAGFSYSVVIHAVRRGRVVVPELAADSR